VPFTERSDIVSCEVVKQADGLLVELTLSSCYDFVDQSCDLVLNHLSMMQKQRYVLLYCYSHIRTICWPLNLIQNSIIS
jgi:hypothetical protein